MIASKRWWCGLAVLGLAMLPGWGAAQTNDTEKALQDAQKALQDAQLRILWRISSAASHRLGATVESPSPAVANQLDLPAGQGQVVTGVKANSAAAKAGIQMNDIILEVDGKPVSSNMAEFEKALNALKPDAGVEAIVLRKGQKTTIKGLTMPKAEQPAPFGNNGFGQLQLAPGTGFEITRAMLVPQFPGQLVPAEVQGRLRLTDEQKEKLARLQKETEAKFMELLTDEQKKQLEELKKNQSQRAQPPQQPRQPQDEIRKQLDEQLKKREAQQEDIRKQLDEQLKKQKEQQEQARKQAEQAQKEVELLFQKVQILGRGAAANRLGATLEMPSDAVANQLNLPQGQGIVVRNVPANSPAAKAGLQPNDILLELGGKTISRNPAEFDKTLEQIKPDAPVDAVVLRKGEKTTVKGVALAAAQPATRTRAMNAAPKIPGDILPAELQGRLRLTDEQKEKLAKLQKETEAKLMELLTDEQKKQLEEIKKSTTAIPLKIVIDNFFLEQEFELELPRK